MGRGAVIHISSLTKRAQHMLRDLESEMINKGGDRIEQRRLFVAFLGFSAIWQPQPCRERNVSNSSTIARPLQDNFADENVNSNIIPNSLGQKFGKSAILPGNPLNIVAKPYYSTKFVAESLADDSRLITDRLKRTRSVSAVAIANLNLNVGNEFGKSWKPMETRSQPNSPKGNVDKWSELSLTDCKDFEDAILAAVLGYSSDVPDAKSRDGDTGKVEVKVEKKRRLKVFQDLVPSLSPRA